MTLLNQSKPLDFDLTVDHEAHEPPEARGLRRDGVRLMVSRGDARPTVTHFANLGAFLTAGDLLVVNTSSTVPAALDGRLPDGTPVVVHLSGVLPADIWLVELRAPSDGSTVPLTVQEACDGRLGRRRSDPPARSFPGLPTTVAGAAADRRRRPHPPRSVRPTHPLPPRRP